MQNRVPGIRSFKPAGILLSALALLGSLTVQAQEYPSRPIRMIVGYNAGSGADIPARMIAEGMAQHLKQSIVVENRPGGNAQISMNVIRNSEPDGYTIMWGGAAPLSVQPMMDTKVSGLEANFNPLDQFSIVAFAGSYDSVLLGGPNGPKDLKELAALMRDPNAHVTYATFAAGSTFDMVPQYFIQLAKGKATGVGYRGSGMLDVMSGTLTTAMETLSSASASQITQGKVRGLAVLQKTRSSKIPNVPTMAEAGFPEMADVDWDAWFGIFVKKGTPPAVINRLNEASRVFLADPKNIARLDGGAFQAYPPTDAREAQARWERNFVTTRTLLGKLNLLPK